MGAVRIQSFAFSSNIFKLSPRSSSNSPFHVRRQMVDDALGSKFASVACWTVRIGCLFIDSDSRLTGSAKDDNVVVAIVLFKRHDKVC